MWSVLGLERDDVRLKLRHLALGAPLAVFRRLPVQTAFRRMRSIHRQKTTIRRSSQHCPKGVTGHVHPPSRFHQRYSTTRIRDACLFNARSNPALSCRHGQSLPIVWTHPLAHRQGNRRMRLLRNRHAAVGGLRTTDGAAFYAARFKDDEGSLSRLQRIYRLFPRNREAAFLHDVFHVRITPPERAIRLYPVAFIAGR
jgi:hypothetical protein